MYNKNAERNRLQDIRCERRRIWVEAVKQAERLTTIHDPPGAIFNVSPVVNRDDGTVVSIESLRRRRKRDAARQAKATRHDANYERN